MPPVVVAAGIAGAATIGGAVMGSKAQKKAAKSAAKTSAANTASNNALARETYNNNAARLDPYSANGLRASNALSEMLLGPAPAYPGFPYAATAEGVAPDTRREAYRQMGVPYRFDSPGNALEAALTRNQEASRSALEPQPVQTGVVTTAPSAWDQFRNSTNYKFRFDEGMKSLNQGLTFNGLGDSGAAVKEALKYGQNFASNELGNYMHLLSQQQNMGLTASSALAGAGQNMVGQVTANNNQAAGDAVNAALVRGNATGNMWSGIASGIGQIAGAATSSYRSPMATVPRQGIGAFGTYYG